MSKKAGIKIIALVSLLAVAYSLFWFFRVGQVEKQISNFVADNALHISAGEISTSGFPLTQKITVKDLKFMIPNAVLNKRQVVVKDLELVSGIFSSDFSVMLPGMAVTLQDSDNAISTVEFSKEPEVKISFSGSRVTNFHYQDSGYRILDVDKSVIYSAASSLFSFESVANPDNSILVKITSDIKDIEKFSVSDMYKNALEKVVIDGIRTGEISVGSDSLALSQDQISATSMPVVAGSPVSTSIPSNPSPANKLDSELVQNSVIDIDAEKKRTEEIAMIVANNELAKNNFIANVEYTIIPAQTDQHVQIPTDPAQIQNPAQLQYSGKSIKISHLEFSNPLYKIIVSGDVATSADDSKPSGTINLKIENIGNLISYMSASLSQIADQKGAAIAAGIQTADMDISSNGMSMTSSYQKFLKKISTNLDATCRELAAKNSTSTAEISEFNIKREKNLEFLINDTSVREVMGKF